MPGLKLLLISAESDDKGFASQAAQIAGLELVQVPDLLEAVDYICLEEPRIIFLDCKGQDHYLEFESLVQEKVGLFSDKINANAIHFLSAEPIENVPYLHQSPLFGHFICRNDRTVSTAGSFYGRIVRATLSERAFGLQNLLNPGTKIQTIKLKSSAQKQGAVDAVRNYLLAARYTTRMATVIANAVDELLMNSMFDAPIDELGARLYQTTPRSTILPLEGKAAVEMCVGYDGDYVGVTAIDLFGSIEKAKLLSHVAKMYREEEYKIRTSVAGAGIGLATVFRSGGSFFFVSESRVRTEVTVFFKLTSNFRDFKDQFRFLSTQFYF